MSPEAWTFAGILTTVGGGGIVAVVVETIRTRRRVERTGDAVDEVKELAAPTGNGFATDVLERLDGIARAVDAQGERLARVESHQQRADDAYLRHLELHAQQPR